MAESRRMKSHRLVQYCYAYADDRKAVDPVILEVKELSSVTDYFFLVTGTSAPHLRAIVDTVVERLKRDQGVRPLSFDGKTSASWVVIDYNDVIVHAMSRATRERYDLESLWGDSPRLKPRRPRGTGRAASALK